MAAAAGGNPALAMEAVPISGSTTVLPLAEAGWSSVHSVINDDQFWEVIDQLKNAGAEGILICPIEKMLCIVPLIQIVASSFILSRTNVSHLRLKSLM